MLLRATLVLALLAAACGKDRSGAPAAASGAVEEARVDTPAAIAPSAESAAAVPASADLTTATAHPAAEVTAASVGDRTPNEHGLIPILEYHLIGDAEARWTRERGRFRQDLELLYKRGYRPITAAELLDNKIDIPAGTSPVVFTFDDASPSHFRYIERPDGTLEIDPTSAVGIWLDFAKSKPDWSNKAVFCVLSGAAAGRSFFGDRGIEGQKSAWRHQKIRFLVEQGFEICNHTLWHAQLDKYSDAVVQEQIARLNLAVDSAVPGYRIRTFALPLGVWPKNRELAWRGSWTDPKSGRTIAYSFDGVLEVAGGPNVSPTDPKFKPHSLYRVQVYRDELEKTLDYLDANGRRYVSAGRKGR